MNLQIPIVSQEPGPQYAQDVNTSLLTIDQHNHAFGNGVQITPNGLNINADLTVQNNNITSLRTVRFTPQTSTITAASPDLGCLYESGVDLYYNDGAGNIVRITQSGGVAGSPGSISGLTSPASASYSAGSQTFTWQSDANTAANMDFGSAIFRNITASSNGVTLSPPGALAADYTITFPAGPPVSTSFVTMDSSGNLGDSIAITSAFVSNGNIVNGTITNSKFAPANYGISTSTGNGLLLGAAGSFQAITQLSVTITTVGRPVRVQLQPDTTAFQAGITPSAAQISLSLFIDGVNTYRQTLFDGSGTSIYPPSMFTWFVPALAAGSHTFAIFYIASSGWEIDSTQLVAEETL